MDSFGDVKKLGLSLQLSQVSSKKPQIFIKPLVWNAYKYILLQTLTDLSTKPTTFRNDVMNLSN